MDTRHIYFKSREQQVSKEQRKSKQGKGQRNRQSSKRKKERYLKIKNTISKDILFLTKKGKIIRINSEDIPLSSLVDKNGKQKSRKPTGVKVISLSPDDELVSLDTA